MRSSLLIPATLLLAAAGCANNPPNIRSSGSYNGPAAPTVRHPFYDPDAAYGTANATWRSPVINRDGTLVKPRDPQVEYGRPDYEHAEWATGASGGSTRAPPGTF